MTDAVLYTPWLCYVYMCTELVWWDSGGCNDLQVAYLKGASILSVGCVSVYLDLETNVLLGNHGKSCYTHSMRGEQLGRKISEASWALRWGGWSIGKAG